ncbi:pre-mRNA-splicing factor 18-like [Lineus longissimus]|uniref:pre-mRNA-splicing factor 18-like n=1 Tax=Lineus longissimus TaxID=88925 RepID=UPI002B4F88F3
MDFLKKEIERKKRQVESSDILAPNKKYFKRGDLAAKQREDYIKRHHGEDSSSSDKQDRSCDSPTPGTSAEKDEKKLMLPRKEVVRRLRERNEPILLFGEDEYEAFQRLKKLEILTPEVNKGFRNELKAAMDQVDQEYLDEIAKSVGEDKDKMATDVKIKEDNVTATDLELWNEELDHNDEGKAQEIILYFLKHILHQWGKDLNSRESEEKRTTRGKLASATHTQTVSYMKPLFRQLKQKKLSSDILDCLIDIIGHLLVRNYIKANDCYLEMAIGNAPWPIGVTMVGIHARTGREKIFARNVAHVLNDETQRKYIQGLKRLMTHCQKYYPTDPSRSVDYDPKHV